jgi:hypothetical protein
LISQRTLLIPWIIALEVTSFDSLCEPLNFFLE